MVRLVATLQRLAVALGEWLTNPREKAPRLPAIHADLLCSHGGDDACGRNG